MTPLVGSGPLLRRALATGALATALLAISTFERGRVVTVSSGAAIVGSLVDGVLERVWVREGDEVEAGQVVATIINDEVRREEARLVEHLACDSMTCVLLREASRIRLRSAGFDEVDLERSLREGPSGRVRLRAPIAGSVRLHGLARGSAITWRDDVLRVESTKATVEVTGGRRVELSSIRAAWVAGESVWIWTLPQ